MLFYDWTWFILIPALAFALWAQSRVTSTFRRFSQVMASSRATGEEAARTLLNKAGLFDVRVERIAGQLSDHYDPRSRVLRLSEPVWGSRSLAALGVAAHEAGHALQHASGYSPLALRNAIVPVAQFGSSLAFPLFFIGFIFNSAAWLMDLGILFFSAAVVFQALTLPVEFDASNRAIRLLQSEGFISGQEVAKTKQVLDAAAMTYVAATAMAALQLLRLVLLRGTRND
jgi:Zn-dependent membrane protease YugP